jgi:small subunit ribosomal protein S1
VGQTVKAQVLELDRERRRIKLGIKQLVPTSVDEYLSEHRVGETVTGRVVQAASGRARVELGEGIFAECRMPEETAAAASNERAPGADLSSLTAMLSAKWKQGAGAATVSKLEPARAGQIRSFRVVRLDPANKKIELELAG